MQRHTICLKKSKWSIGDGSCLIFEGKVGDTVQMALREEPSVSIRRYSMACKPAVDRPTKSPPQPKYVLRLRGRGDRSVRAATGALKRDDFRFDHRLGRHCLRQTRSVCARERQRRSNPDLF